MTATTLAGKVRRLPKTTRTAGLFNGVMDTMFLWHGRARDRRALARLSDHALRDIGITRMDVEHELYKPVWQS